MPISTQPCKFRRFCEPDAEGLCLHCLRPVPGALPPSEFVLNPPPSWWTGATEVALFRNPAYPAPPLEAMAKGLVSEPLAANGYRRVLVPPNGWARVGKLWTNMVKVVFPAPTGSWGRIAASGLFLENGGLLISIAPLTTPVTIDLSTTVPEFLAGSCIVAGLP